MLTAIIWATITSSLKYSICLLITLSVSGLSLQPTLRSTPKGVFLTPKSHQDTVLQDQVHTLGLSPQFTSAPCQLIHQPIPHATVLLHPYQTYLKFQPYVPFPLRAASRLPLCLQDTNRLLQAATPHLHALSELTSPSSEPPQTCTSPQPPYTPT